MRRGFRPYSFYARIVVPEARAREDRGRARRRGRRVVRRQRARGAVVSSRGARRASASHRELRDERGSRVAQSHVVPAVRCEPVRPRARRADGRVPRRGRAGGLSRAARRLRAGRRGSGAVAARSGTSSTARPGPSTPSSARAMARASSSPSERAGARAIRFPANEAAAKHGASSERDTTDGGEAYARFPSGYDTQYRDGLLPS